MAESSKKQRGRGRGKPFQKGQSGNPGGRPKLPPEVHEVRALAREYTIEALEGLMAIARSKKAPAAARVAAYRDVIDRGHGRPTQAVEVTGKDGSPLVPRFPVKGLSDATLAELEDAYAKDAESAPAAAPPDAAGSAG